MEKNYKQYWRSSIKITLFILVLWFVNSLILGILFTEKLNSISFLYQFGFWYSQQGTILVFVFLIILYVLMMNSLDKKHGFLQKKEKKAGEKTND